MLRKLSIIVLLIVLSSVVLLANTISAIGLVFAQTTGVDPNALINLFMPIIVWLASAFVNWLKATLGKAGFSGAILVTFIVPILSALAGYIATLISPELNFWPLFGLGLAGVFVNEALKQWSQSKAGIQKATKTKLIG